MSHTLQYILQLQQNELENGITQIFKFAFNVFFE